MREFQTTNTCTQGIIHNKINLINRIKRGSTVTQLELLTFSTPTKKIKVTQIASVVRQKGESQNGCFKKTKHAKFSERTNISYPLIRARMCAYQGPKNVRFSEHLAYSVFLKHTFWDSPFCLTTHSLYHLFSDIGKVNWIVTDWNLRKVDHL